MSNAELLEKLESLAENKETAPNSQAHDEYCEEIADVKREVLSRMEGSTGVSAGAKFEYGYLHRNQRYKWTLSRVSELKSDNELDALTELDALNELGAQGWELAALTGATLVMKRNK
jgi:hypothetical protein